MKAFLYPPDAVPVTHMNEVRMRDNVVNEKSGGPYYSKGDRDRDSGSGASFRGGGSGLS